MNPTSRGSRPRRDDRRKRRDEKQRPATQHTGQSNAK